MSTSGDRKRRHQRILKLLRDNPLLTDEALANALGVSLSTVRLDRALLGIPEFRERMRKMAEEATSRLRSLRYDEVVGELVELQPNKLALSVLQTTGDMAFRDTDLVADHHIYAQATSLAIAVVEADYVITASAHIRYKVPARVGDMLVARAKVGTHKQNKYIVSVRTKVEGKEIFIGRFIVAALESYP
ncbi:MULTISPECIES: transcription factor FapR [Acetomicrobium]|uniref:Transcription factor FapR n=1 Tax=Acetomicrobium hydrogeniformans TaxID=649746 RepID=A0A7V7BZ82_9BACT|nr:transcription factor FapR [Acetomicrobium hydrogeniformans]